MGSMRIVVSCGAGASSTFIAARLQRAADSAGVALDASASSLASLAQDMRGAAAVLLGAHMGDSANDVRAIARKSGAHVAVLPADIAGDRDGTRVLAIVRNDVLGSAPLEHTPRKEHTMATRTVTIASSHGLHARPAKLFSEAAKNSGLTVTIAKGDGTPANAASILSVIALGANTGDEVTLSVEGDGAEAVLDQLATMLETDAE